MRFIIVAISLLMFSHPASAEEARAAALQDGALPEPVAIICFDPVSGDQAEIDLRNRPAGSRRCPDGHVAFPTFQVELAPGADPVPFESKNHQDQAEVRDAPMDQQ